MLLKLPKAYALNLLSKSKESCTSEFRSCFGIDSEIRRAFLEQGSYLECQLSASVI